MYPSWILSLLQLLSAEINFFNLSCLVSLDQPLFSISTVSTVTESSISRNSSVLCNSCFLVPLSCYPKRFHPGIKMITGRRFHERNMDDVFSTVLEVGLQITPRTVSDAQTVLSLALLYRIPLTFVEEVFLTHTSFRHLENVGIRLGPEQEIHLFPDKRRRQNLLQFRLLASVRCTDLKNMFLFSFALFCLIMLNIIIYLTDFHRCQI